jgi:predicted DNA-binding transcriptional regulator AlpA
MTPSKGFPRSLAPPRRAGSYQPGARAGSRASRRLVRANSPADTAVWPLYHRSWSLALASLGPARWLGGGRWGGEEILRCEDLARILGCTAKAVRYRVKCGQLPPPFRLGKALAWLRDPVFEWLRDRSRSAGPAQMKINLRPYAHDQTRWHVDIRIMHPTTHKEIRRRLVAPAGLSEARARSWGEHQVPKILGEVLGAVNDAPRDKEAPHPQERPTPTPPRRLSSGWCPRPAPAMTIAELFCQRFEPEYVRLQKPRDARQLRRGLPQLHRPGPRRLAAQRARREPALGVSRVAPPSPGGEHLQLRLQGEIPAARAYPPSRSPQHHDRLQSHEFGRSGGGSLGWSCPGGSGRGPVLAKSWQKRAARSRAPPLAEDPRDSRVIRGHSGGDAPARVRWRRVGRGRALPGCR